MERSHARLVKLRETSDLFDGEPISIFSDGLIRLSGSLKNGALVNWESPRPQGRISCLLPDATKTGPMAFEIADEPEEGMEPFIEFGCKVKKPSGPRLSS